LGLWPSWPNLILVKGVFGKTHPYAFPFYFTPLCFDIWSNEPFSDIRKFWKNLGIFIDLFMGIFDLWAFTMECESDIQYKFFFSKKIKRKLVSFSFNLNFMDLFTDTRIMNIIVRPLK
jgi:hypothetical protein